MIFGGGIAGLWMANRLTDEGYHVIIIEPHELGGQQTRCSQGIIHGGTKYALNAVLSTEVQVHRANARPMESLPRTAPEKST